MKDEGTMVTDTQTIQKATHHTTQQDSAMTCPVCEGRGYVTTQELYQKLGVETLANMANIGAKKAYELLDQHGLKFFEKIKLDLKTELNKQFQDQMALERERIEQRHANEIGEKNEALKHEMEQAASLRNDLKAVINSEKD